MREQAFDADQRAVIYAPGEGPTFTPGDHVRILSRTPVAPHRLPFYLLGKRGTIESVIRSAVIDNHEGAVAGTAESKPHYYRVAVPMTEIWPDYVGSPRDGLRVEIFETWLAER
jgi:hypothetical protein